MRAVILLLLAMSVSPQTAPAPRRRAVRPIPNAMYAADLADDSLQNDGLPGRVGDGLLASVRLARGGLHRRHRRLAAVERLEDGDHIFGRDLLRPRDECVRLGW